MSISLMELLKQSKPKELRSYHTTTTAPRSRLNFSGLLTFESMKVRLVVILGLSAVCFSSNALTVNDTIDPPTGENWINIPAATVRQDVLMTGSNGIEYYHIVRKTLVSTEQDNSVWHYLRKCTLRGRGKAPILNHIEAFRDDENPDYTTLIVYYTQSMDDMMQPIASTTVSGRWEVCDKTFKKCHASIISQ